MDEFPWLPILLLICAALVLLSIAKWAVAYVQYHYLGKVIYKKKKKRHHHRKKNYESSSSEESSSE